MEQADTVGKCGQPIVKRPCAVEQADRPLQAGRRIRRACQSSTRLLLTSSRAASSRSTRASRRTAPRRPAPGRCRNAAMLMDEVDAERLCSWSNPQRMFACLTQRVMLSRSSSLKPNRALIGGACARLSTSLAVTGCRPGSAAGWRRRAAGWSGSASGQPAGPGAGAPDGRRVRRRRGRSRR